MKILAKIKKWWADLALIKCDYCGNKVKHCYDAYNTPVFGTPDYKGPEICIDCVKKLPQDGIMYMKL